MNPLLMTTVAELDARLHEQVLEVASLKLALDIQGTRIAHMHKLSMAPDCRSFAPPTREASPHS